MTKSKKPKATITKKPPLNVADITASLEAIDNESRQSKLVAAKPRRRSRHKPQQSRRKQIIKRSIVVLLIILALVAGFYAYRAITSGSRMFQGNIFDALQNKPLQKDQFGRSNVLLFGTSEDEEGHSGADLADSIMVLSIDQETKQANMMSIPRDLWVDYPDGGCSVGNEGKINAVYMCAMELNGGDKEAASLRFAKKVGEVIGTDVQYYARVNYAVVRDLVDSLGGIDVVIDSDDPRGILDRNFDKNCPNGPYTCHFVKYENGPAHLDGESALALSRARNAKGGYGLSGSNFDREKNQQMILKGVQKKALTTGTLTNPNRILSLIDSMGNNVSSNLQASELRTVMGIAQSVDPDNIISLDLRKADSASLVTTGDHMGQSIVRPVRGLKDYTDIQAFVADSFASAESDGR